MTIGMTLVSVDLVVFRLKDEQLQILTRYQKTKKGLELALPSGRIDTNTDTSLDDTAQRLLSYATCQKAAYMEQVGTIGDAKRDSRGWSMTVVYYALVNDRDSQNADDAYWVTLNQGQPEKMLAYDHNNLVQEALLRLKNKIQYSTVPIYLLPEEFALSDIKKVFAAILDTSPPMRSIRNRFLRDNLLVDTGRQRRGSNRPATLYRVNETAETCLFNRLYLTTQGIA